MKVATTITQGNVDQTGRPAPAPRRSRLGRLSGGLPLANAAALLPGNNGLSWHSGAQMHSNTLSGQWGLLPAVLVGAASIALLIKRRARVHRSDRTSQ
jgi:hypothetical protein